MVKFHGPRSNLKTLLSFQPWNSLNHYNTPPLELHLINYLKNRFPFSMGIQHSMSPGQHLETNQNTNKEGRVHGEGLPYQCTSIDQTLVPTSFPLGIRTLSCFSRPICSSWWSSFRWLVEPRNRSMISFLLRWSQMTDLRERGGGGKARERERERGIEGE